MLKAVRFDPETHKELINYIESYLDKRGKPNHSEAIRLLMEKGYEVLHGKSNAETVVETQPQVDLDKFREDIIKEIFETIGKNAIAQPIIQPQIIQSTPITQIQEPKEEIKKEPVNAPAPKPKPPANVGGLMGNLLSNANRG